MTEDEIYQIYLDMMNERKEAGKIPWEPSRMEFGIQVAKVAVVKGYNEGISRARIAHPSGDPQ